MDKVVSPESNQKSIFIQSFTEMKTVVAVRKVKTYPHFQQQSLLSYS